MGYSWYTRIGPYSWVYPWPMGFIPMSMGYPWEPYPYGYGYGFLNSSNPWVLPTGVPMGYSWWSLAQEAQPQSSGRHVVCNASREVEQPSERTTLSIRRWLVFWPRAIILGTQASNFKQERWQAARTKCVSVEAYCVYHLTRRIQTLTERSACIGHSVQSDVVWRIVKRDGWQSQRGACSCP